MLLFISAHVMASPWISFKLSLHSVNFNLRFETSRCFEETERCWIHWDEPSQSRAAKPNVQGLSLIGKCSYKNYFFLKYILGSSWVKRKGTVSLPAWNNHSCTGNRQPTVFESRPGRVVHVRKIPRTWRKNQVACWMWKVSICTQFLSIFSMF